MFPSGFVDGGKKTDDFIVMRPLVNKVGESADHRDNDKTKPEIKGIIHAPIIALVVYFRDRYGIIGGGSVAEWLKAHDSKSCRLARVSGVRISPLPPSLYL